MQASSHRVCRSSSGGPTTGGGEPLYATDETNHGPILEPDNLAQPPRTLFPVSTCPGDRPARDPGLRGSRLGRRSGARDFAGDGTGGRGNFVKTAVGYVFMAPPNSSASHLGLFYRRRYEFDFRGLRYPAVVAPGVTTPGAAQYLSLVIEASAKGQSFTITVGPETRFPVMYVKDAARAIVELATAPRERIQTVTYLLAGVSPVPSAGELVVLLRTRVPGAQIEFRPDPTLQRLMDPMARPLVDDNARTEYSKQVVVRATLDSGATFSQGGSRQGEALRFHACMLRLGACREGVEVHARQTGIRGGDLDQRVPQGQLPEDSQRQHLEGLEGPERAGGRASELELADLRSEPARGVLEHAGSFAHSPRQRVEHLAIRFNLSDELRGEVAQSLARVSIPQHLEERDGRRRAAEMVFEVRGEWIVGHRVLHYYVYRVEGTRSDGAQVDMWLRATVCYRRGRMICGWFAHEHQSVPFDPTTGKASLDLKP
jgi:hypothetical protein